MKLETFFEKFEVLAEMPGAVGKLRSLILQLAIAGNLVAQDPNDEPAEALLSRIYAESHVDAEPINPAYKLPSSWQWVRLGRLLPTFQNGASSRGDSNGMPTTVLRLADIYSCRISLQNTRTININQSDLAKYRLKVGDMLITRVNGSADIVGRFIPIDRDLDAIYCDHFIRMRLNQSAIFPMFVALLGGTSVVREQVRRSFVSTAGQKTVNQGHISALVIPLPPLAEQKRIVAKVGELMALCDRLEAQQQERETRHSALAGASLAQFADAPTPDNLDYLFHSSYEIGLADLRNLVLTLAVQGKLVPQDPFEESAGEWLLRLGIQSTITPTDESPADYSIPLSWTRLRFEDIAKITGGVTLGRKLGNRSTVSLPYLRVANVKRGEIDLRQVKEVAIGENEIERYSLRENDLLLTEGGDWDKVGRAAIWRGEIGLCLHQNHVFRARMRANEITPFWFERYLNSPIGRRYFESASKQTTNLASINMRQVKNCPVPIPPPAEQRRIVSKVNELMALIDRMETNAANSHAASASLLELLPAAAI